MLGWTNMYSVYSQIKSCQYVAYCTHTVVLAQICVRDIPTTTKYLRGQECQIIFFLWVRGLKSRW